MRGRWNRVVQDEWVDGLEQSCWSQMPEELLREVLIRIEASDTTWPSRKNVVTCAGVCKSWRRITQELVKTPEVSALLTFPISVKQVFVFYDSFLDVHSLLLQFFYAFWLFEERVVNLNLSFGLSFLDTVIVNYG